jgi:hypothetical protein
MKNKYLLFIVLVFLLIGSVAFAQEQTDTTIAATNTTVTTILTSTTLETKTSMPLSFTLNK